MTKEKPTLFKAELAFSQPGNTLGTTDDYEYLTINLESQAMDEEMFYVINTNGWSFDDISEIEKLLKRANRLLNTTPAPSADKSASKCFINNTL